MTPKKSALRRLACALALAAALLPRTALGADDNRLGRLSALADSLHAAGRTDSALVVGREAARLARSPEEHVATCSSLGVFLRSLGRTEEALESYARALDVVTSGRLGAKPGEEACQSVATLYVNLAALHLDMAHKDEARRRAREAVEWAGRCRDAAMRAGISSAAGGVLMAAGDYSDALDCQQRAYRAALDAGDADAALRAAAYALMAADLLKDGGGVARWRAACEELAPRKETTMMARLLHLQAECVLALHAGDHGRAIRYFDRILGLEGIAQLPFVQFDVLNNRHLSLAALGRWREAYECLTEAGAVRDTIYAREKAESLRELEVKYETRQKELDLSRSEAARARTLAGLVATGLAFVALTFVFALYAARERRRRLERQIEYARLSADLGRRLTRRYLDGLESERERMARELHDGVCNDLMALRLGLAGDGEAARLVDGCREAVRRISHELMPPEFAYATLDEVLRYYVTTVCAAPGGRPAAAYTSEADAPWESVPDDVAYEVYRIVQEAVGNALGHGGTDVTVGATLLGGRLRVEVRSTGAADAAGAPGGIGLRTMRRRAAALGGTLDCGPGEGGWTMRLEVTVGPENARP